MLAARTSHGAPLLGFVCFLVLFATGVTAQTREEVEESTEAERLQFGISVDTVEVSSDFAGRNIVIFGTIENANRIAQVYNEYAVVVAIRGPVEDVLVRRKERVLGVWANRETRRYRNVPSFYAIASSRPLESVAEKPELRQHQLGVDSLSLNLFSSGNQTFILPAPEFAASLRRIRRGKGLFTENEAGVRFLGSSLFRATLYLPSNIPIGTHTVTTYLFRKGELIASRVDSFDVEKVGFEKRMYTLAHEYSILYGFIAVLVALSTGWLASVIFGRR